MNIVALTGHLGKDPEKYTFEDGNVKTTFSIAVDDGYYNKSKEEWVEKAIWVNIVIFKETKMIKGDLVEVVGKLNLREYEDKDGNTRYITEVVTNNIKLLKRKK